MPIVLFRVDERLIHGQVVVGWGARVNADRIVVVDDELSRSSWEQELYSLGVPAEMETSFVDVGEARRSFRDWKEGAHRRIVLVRNVETLRRLAADSLLAGEEVNLGGIHHAAGRERLLPYLFLNSEEQQELREVAAMGVILTARDLPGSRPVPLQELLDGKEG